MKWPLFHHESHEEALGEFGIRGRRYFRRENREGKRTHHLHVFQEEDAEVRRHLAFRDFLKRHPDWAQRYSELKQRLALRFPDNSESYIDGKDAFIREVDRRATG